jgi:WD40 repeat protein
MSPPSRKPSGPYVGPRAFLPGEPIFGRDRETDNLFDLVRVERLVLLHSKSGAGKTSLVQAAIVPRFHKRGVRVYGPLRVSEPVDADGVENLHVQSVLRGLAEAVPRIPVPPTELAQLDLPRFFAQYGVKPEAEEEFLFFDQFEEILTRNPTDWESKQRFFEQLGKVLRAAHRSALFAMREEFVAALDPYLHLIPRGLSVRFQLEFLSTAAAQDAIVLPARAEPWHVTIERAAADELIRDLSRVRVRKSDGTFGYSAGTSVEPVQLQVVCLRLWEKRLSDQITKQDVVNVVVDVDTALGGYYDDKVRAIAQHTGVPERSIRDWCDRELITDGRTRDQIAADSARARKLVEDVLQSLINAYLIRTERRRDMTWYELAHDRLIDPIRTSNISWREKHLHPMQPRAQLWGESNRPDSLLLRDQELGEAERWADEATEALMPLEREFLDACRNARETARQDRLRAEKIARDRQRFWIIFWIIVSLSSGLVIALILGTIAMKQWWRADEQRLKAEELSENLSKQSALAAYLRHKAERLSARLSMERGLSYCEDGDVGLGMLWLTRSLKEIPTGDEALQRAIRAQLSNWLPQLHELQEQLPHQGPVWAVVFGPGGRVVLTGSDDHTARLWDIATGKLKGKPMKHDDKVWAVAFSRDGKTVLTGSNDHTARLWEAATGKPKGKPMKHDSAIRKVAFSPDDNTILTGSEDGTAQLWDAATGKLKGEPMKHDDKVWAVVFSRDGKTVLTGSNDHTARLWEAATGKPKSKPMKHDGAIRAVAFSPDDKTILTGGDDGTARLWEAATGKSKGAFMNHKGSVWTVAFSGDGKTVLTGSEDGTARLWDAATGKPRGEGNGRLFQHGSTVRVVAFSPDSYKVLTGSVDNTARLWDAVTGQPIGPPLQHRSPVWAAAFAPDGQSVLTGSEDGTARLWRIASHRPRHRPLRHEKEVLAVALSHDGKKALTGSKDGTAQLWETATGKPIGKPMKHKAPVLAVAFSRDGKTVLTGSDDHTAQRWDAATGERKGEPMSHGGAVLAVAFSPDGKSILTGVYDDHTARLWDIATGKLKGEPMKHDDKVWAVAFSRDGKTVLTGSEDHKARLWEAATGMPRGGPIKHKAPVWAVAFRPDDDTAVLTGSDDGTVRLWDMASHQPRGEPMKHEGPVRAVAFSPDGKIILTGGFDNTARLWDAATGKPRGEPMNHKGPVRAVAFGPKGQNVVTGSDDGEARLWDAATGNPIRGPLRHKGAVRAVAFSPDGKAVLTGSFDSTAQLWHVPAPLDGKIDRIVLWMQVVTGLELDELGDIRFLDHQKWHQYRQTLQQLGGPPQP